MAAVLPVLCFILLFVTPCMTYLQLVEPGYTTATSSSIYSGYPASRAVDGNFSQHNANCSHTADTGQTEAWLRVDLKKTFSIKSVKFWYRNDRGSDSKNTIRLLGYSIRVSNDSLSPPESTCYTDLENVTLPTFIEKDCERTARYVWIYQNNTWDGSCPMLEICEVQVFGCKLGTDEEDCKKACSHCKNNASCGAASGKCNEEGCSLQGFQPPYCQNCLSGKYGPACGKNCSEFCTNRTCNETTGSCLHGCQPGYTGTHCNKSCEGNTYGKDCTEACGHCLHHQCNHVDGTCVGGCEAGYRNDLCNTSCDDGMYGENCLKNCSGHCLGNEACDRFSGTCQACGAGFQGTMCDQKCGHESYGQNCSEKCGACLIHTDCDHVTGQCSSGCQPGWWRTDKCDKVCINGTYGTNCSYDCSFNCANGETCNKQTGHCKSCAPGWTGNFCNASCGNGSYGPMCSSRCGACAEPDVCFHTNGSCPGGCNHGYTGDMCNVRVIEVPSSYANIFGLDFSSLLMISVSIEFVILVLIAVTILLVFRKRSQKKDKEDDASLQNVVEDDPDEEEDSALNEDNILYDDIQIRSKGIKITELSDTIKSLAKDSKKGFQEEFHAIPYGEQSDIACTIGKLPENIPKNRFKTTFPYDHSRVVLQSSNNGDYINANYIKNADSEVAYIASQGPKPNTVGDFWNMVWQENVFVIAMVTNLTEGDKKKCERYWPLSKTSEMIKEYFVLQLKSEKIYANFVIHEIKILNRQSNDTRHVTHLQYTAWPDHGTPTPLELLVFYYYVSKAMETYPENKLLVHCSAGIGRTGTFIALDALHRQGQSKGRINIVEYVHTMREDRMNMIQNANQYEFLYEVLFESFQGKSYAIRKENFVEKVESQSTPDKAVNLSNFKKEFQELETLRPTFNDDELEIAKSHLDLNMTQTVLPSDNMRIILTSQVAGRDAYYNAVPISAITSKDVIIAAQYPVPGASVDLIRLLVDHNCTKLVSTNPISDIPSSQEWFRSFSVLDYRVEVKHAVKLSSNVTKTTMNIQAPTIKKWHKVSVYEITTWKSESSLPSDVHSFIDAMKFVLSGETSDSDQKMAILSRDGATGCGVFCAVYNALQQIQQDEEVDMFTIVRLLQSRRPQMISDVNEYVFCYQALADFIKSESEDLYMNSPSAPAVKEENLYANT